MFLALAAVLLLLLRSPAEPLKLVQTIPLEGVEGRIDHLAVDVKGMRLFVAALGNNTLEIIDLRAGKRIHSIKGLHEPQGVAFLPDSNRIAVANGQGEGLDLYDGSAYKLAGQVKLGDDSDNVRYDPNEQRIYVGYGSGALGLIDARTLKVISRIPLPAHPESFQLSKQGPLVYVNLPNANQIAALDKSPSTVRVKLAWSEPHARNNYPMALDEEDGYLFVGYRDPPVVFRQPLHDNRTKAWMPISGDTDDIFVDRKRGRVYASCGAGFLETYDMVTDKTPYHQSRIATHPGARTSLFVPELDRLYLAVPHRGNAHAEIRVYAPQ